VVQAVQEAGQQVETVSVEAVGHGFNLPVFQSLVDRFRGQVGQIHFGSGVADFQAKMGVAAGDGR